MNVAPDVATLFFAGARTIADAIADPAVERAWDLPSVLEDQLVSSVVGHLARSGVWALDEYLHAGTPTAQPTSRAPASTFAPSPLPPGPTCAGPSGTGAPRSRRSAGRRYSDGSRSTSAR